MSLADDGWVVFLHVIYIAFSHDVTATIMVFQNNETAVILVYLFFLM